MKTTGDTFTTKPANTQPLTADTLVFWPNDREPNGGSYSRFGTLMSQDRHVVEWDAARGEYVGDYGF